MSAVDRASHTNPRGSPLGPEPTAPSRPGALTLRPGGHARPMGGARAGERPDAGTPPLSPSPGGVLARPPDQEVHVPHAPRRPCPAAGCAATIARNERACPDHAAQYERARGTRQQRGYGTEHEAERARWAPIIASGTAHCVRCGGLIVPGTPWHPDHTDDRTGYLGPAHARCNLSAAGRSVKHRGNDR